MNANILTLLQAVWTAVKIVEAGAAAVSTKPSSVDKANAAISLIDGIVGNLPNAATVLQPIIDGVVKIANLFGTFQKPAA